MAWLTFLSFCLLVFEVVADYCGNDIFCHSPYKCCITKKGCCYDSMLHNSRPFRLQIWNMWYFWFLIIFMMMSCFGGCGYYRRRRLAMMSHASSPVSTQPIALPVPRQRVDRGQERATTLNFFAYSGPGEHAPRPVSNLPPAYGEVVNHPGMYPVNKVELPPYPGLDKPEDGQDLTLTNHPDNWRDMSQPPPYSEYQYNPPPAAVTGITDSPQQPVSTVHHYPQTPAESVSVDNSTQDSAARSGENAVQSSRQ